MKTDARIRYTRMAIKKSFISLINEKPVNKVTVKDVCDRAEINRATFYKHYKDCFDLLERIESEMIDQLKQLVREAQGKSMSTMFEKMFMKIKNESDLYLTVASDNGDTGLPSRILNMFYKEAHPYFEVLLRGNSNQREDWLYYFVANGCAGILSYWINTGMKENTKEMADYISKMIDKSTQ
ncbi:hypothetical protein A5868_001379 [Enterococcus sp. 12F9_DIV0723]|uniref:TetR/AcrR family transcriptional regulator n=1 Tax=Enterococcus sp. 12F9_DIV0723 TaxID=1834169 RepID=UPI000B3EB2EE|nr:TetR/AcrR family transcriptional regulator [Enterococcus sp. 12F9_DIV0723]OUZ16458.1 hypothetical protein A5868_001379 [Enterococcus sp. 12F9_DIV0723]